MKRTDGTLWALARCPFLSADDLALLNGTRARVARAHLLRLCRAGLAECVHVPHTRLHLYYLTPAGIAAAARAADTDPEVLAALYALGERALLRRLPGLDRLVAGRRVLFALHHALAARGGALEEWRAWPVPWRYTQGTQQRVLPLDGEGLVRLPGSHAERWPIGFLWDGDGSAPAAVLSERLMDLDRLHHAEAERGARATGVPPVLLVTGDPDRVPPGYRPGLLWTTCMEIAGKGVLGAAWRGSSIQGEMLPLPTALTTTGIREADPLLESSLPGVVRRPSQSESARPLRLQQRARTLRHTAREEDGLSLLSVAIPPRGFTVLELVGRHPLLSAADLARAVDMNPVDTWVTLALVRRHGLVEAWTPPQDRRTRRHILTRRGLRLLALRAGITPAAYRRIYGVLDDTEEKTRHGLAFARANLAHTDGINRAYLALLAAVRVSGGKLEWRGEWACTHTFADGARLHTLRPDAEGTYIGHDGTLHFYLEVDRGTVRLWRLATKLAQYYAFRASRGNDQITLLLITNGRHRVSEVLHLNKTVAARAMATPLDLRATTDTELATHGAGARIWHTMPGARATALLRCPDPQGQPITEDKGTSSSQEIRHNDYTGHTLAPGSGLPSTFGRFKIEGFADWHRRICT